MRAPIKRSVRHKTPLTLSRVLRNGVQPHTRSGGGAACKKGCVAWPHKALIAAIAGIAAAAGSPAFADGPADRVVLHTNQERIGQHTNQGLEGLMSVPVDPVPWLGPFGVTERFAMSLGRVTGLPTAVSLFDVPVLPDPWAHGNSPPAAGVAGSVPAPAILPLLGMAMLARTGRTRRRLDSRCTMGWVK